MRYRRTAMLAVSSVVVTVLVAMGAAVAFFIAEDDDAPATPSFVEVPAEALMDGTYCDEQEWFCLTEESLAAGFALATVNERSFSLHADKGGCPAEWLADFDLSRVNGGTGTGAFRVPCDGQTFNPVGTRLFGPAPGDMTRLPLSHADGVLRVDLRPLNAFLP